MTPAVIVGIISSVLAVTSLLYTVTNNRSGYSKITENRLASLETKVDLFWRNLSVDAAKILHSPDPAKARQDALLERFMDETIEPDEVTELVTLLEAILHEHDAQPGQRLAASVVLQAVQVRFGAL